MYKLFTGELSLQCSQQHVLETFSSSKSHYLSVCVDNTKHCTSLGDRALSENVKPISTSQSWCLSICMFTGISIEHFKSFFFFISFLFVLICSKTVHLYVFSRYLHLKPLTKEEQKQFVK